MNILDDIVELLKSGIIKAGSLLQDPSDEISYNEGLKVIAKELIGEITICQHCIDGDD